MPSLPTLKLIGIGIGALAVIALLAVVNTWRVQAKDRGEKLAVICQATRDASGHKNLKCGEVVQQIKFMGETIGTLTRALDKQNAAVDAMGAETKRQQAEAAEASQKAQERVGRADATSRRLSASAAHGSSSVATGACQPSKELERAWQ